MVGSAGPRRIKCADASRRNTSAVLLSTTETQTVPEGGTLGTFGGVFTPSILTILGLVLFLRVGYVVGSVGLVQSLLILAVVLLRRCSW